MSKKFIRIKEIEGERIEINEAGSTKVIKKQFNEKLYCELINDFFKQAAIKHLTREEQIIARGYLAWSYFWPETIYHELLKNYPLEEYEYATEDNSRLHRYLSWLEDKPAWNILHWLVYLFFYLPALKLRLLWHRHQVLVGFSINDPRWKGFIGTSVLTIGGGNWLRSSWFHSFPLLHPRRYALKKNIVDRTLSQIKNMQLSVDYLAKCLSGFNHEFHFWDDFNFTYPLRLAADKAGIKFIIHQHAPSFSSIHVTGQVLHLNDVPIVEIWACWDRDWQRVAESWSKSLVFKPDQTFSPLVGDVNYDQSGAVVFPWEAYCDNSQKRKAIKYAIERGLTVAIKLRPGENENYQRLGFGASDLNGVVFFHDWKELKQGVRCVVGGQTALIYQCFKMNIPVLVQEYLSQTYSLWLDHKQSSDRITRCRSEEQLLLALQALG